MTERVVHVLEVVDVEAKHGEGPSPRGAGQCPLQLLMEQHSIG